MKSFQECSILYENLAKRLKWSKPINNYGVMKCKARTKIAMIGRDTKDNSIPKKKEQNKRKGEEAGV